MSFNEDIDETLYFLQKPRFHRGGNLGFWRKYRVSSMFFNEDIDETLYFLQKPRFHRGGILPKLTGTSYLVLTINLINTGNGQDPTVSVSSVESLNKRRACIFVRKCLDGFVPNNFASYFKINSHGMGTRNASCLILLPKGPVTLLRMRETYEKRMKINAIIFIRTKIL